MKIKIIDLLNKIENDEEVPKKIKWQGHIYEYSCSNRFYYQNSWSMYRDFYKEGNCLNDEVEIIEEPKKIEKLEPVRGSDLSDLTDKDMVLKNNALIELCKTLNNMNNKINELIDEINNLKDK